ncbi:MAG TPA: hypothetical protein VIF62_13400 [Labilithrix sp.]
MAHFLTLALSFPSIVFTILLGVAFVYWLFVIIGAARINLLGDADLDADADLDHDLDHDGAADHDADHDGHDAEGGGGSHGLLAALMLRKAPATIVLSSVILFSWVLSIFGAEAANLLLSGGLAMAVKLAVLLVAPVISLFPTSLVVRPIGRMFTMPEAAASDQLVGKVCTIRTGTVTDRFGEATLEDGGAGVVVRVRVDAGEKLERGQQALIVGYDEAKQEFTVAPMDELLGDGERERRSAKR